ncbi:GHKL domain-containing protein [Chitinophaga lutea]|uniref:GHKL domain-containing protein n=1 Tax=Chitinophaga lutea TaxID=2488634 RepID=A0A3N4PJS1_9BACT|nr:histidine kinase [Chitinophaga lutea]RPE08065.1 GHKL domain-containing protein [Chitinophaga lutea]
MLSIPAARYNWFFRYKLYHLPFWFFYHLLWWTLTIGSVWAVLNNVLYTPYAIKFLFYVIFQAAGVYFNLYFLLPRLLEKGHYITYVVTVIATIICVGALIVPGYYVSSWMSGRSLQELYGVEPSNWRYFFQVNTLPSSAASMTLAMSVKLTKNWVQARNRTHELEKEKLETELKFLKSQFNPHFLFNTINSIFVLIHKNPDMASESLAKFSSLLRYQLYECNEHEIPLEQELAYLENFIELEKLRQEHNITTTVDIDGPPYTGCAIAPFILMPFMENAFKHVSQHKDAPNWISMRLRFSQQSLQLEVANSVASQPSASQQILPYGGIGLKNVQRRLDLVYPGHYGLEVRQEETVFRISLRLHLHRVKAVPEPIPA